MVASSEHDERRNAIRVPVRLDARMFPGGCRCVIRDLSATGARVQLIDRGSAPDELILVLWDSGQAFEAQAVWWLNDEIGVRFIRACELTQQVPLPFGEAKLAWQQSRTS